MIFIKRFLNQKGAFFLTALFHAFQRAEMAMADLTINYQREMVVDFTMPFLDLGMYLFIAFRLVSLLFFCFSHFSNLSSYKMFHFSVFEVFWKIVESGTLFFQASAFCT